MIITLTKDIVKNVSWLKYIFMEKINLEEKNIKNKVNLLNVKIKTRNGKINWKKVAKFFNNKCVNILFGEDIKVPQNLNFKKFHSLKYQRRLCINAALDVLKSANIDANKVKILIIDELGEYSNDIHKFVRFSNQMGVFTKNKKAYAIEEDSLMEQYGASLFITENKNFISKYNLIICPQKLGYLECCNNRSIFFTTEENKCLNRSMFFYNYEVKLPRIYRKFKPSLVSDKDFSEAIFFEYEFEDLKNMVPVSCKSFCESVNLRDLAIKIKEQF